MVGLHQLKVDNLVVGHHQHELPVIVLRFLRLHLETSLASKVLTASVTINWLVRPLVSFDFSSVGEQTGFTLRQQVPTLLVVELWRLFPDCTQLLGDVQANLDAHRSLSRSKCVGAHNESLQAGTAKCLM